MGLMHELCHKVSGTRRFQLTVDDGWGFSEYEVLDSANYIIDEFFEQVKSFTYVYDFGDDWRYLWIRQAF